jgi:hypothetical protein
MEHFLCFGFLVTSLANTNDISETIKSVLIVIQLNIKLFW